MEWRVLVGGRHGELVLAFGAGPEHLAVQRILLGSNPGPSITLIRGNSPDFPIGPAAMDCVIFSPGVRLTKDLLARALAVLKPGGEIAVGLDNRWGLEHVAGFIRHQSLLVRAGVDAVRSFAVLPHYETPRAVVPVSPPSPARAQKFAIEQAWRRISPISALARHSLGLLVDVGLMRFVYPHYLTIGRKRL